MEFLNNYQVPNLRVSEKEKYEKDFDQFKRCMNQIKPYQGYGLSLIRDFPEKLQNYRMLNNDIRQEDVESLCNPLNYSKDAFEEEILPFNIIPKIINELIGEEIRRSDVYTPILTSQKALYRKDYQLQQSVEKYVADKINMIYVLEEQRMMNSELPKQELEKMLQQKRQELESKIQRPLSSGFLSEQEILASKILKYANFDQNIRYTKNETQKDFLTVDEEIVYVGVQNNKPVINKLNPLFSIYHKSPETMYIQDGDQAGYSIPMTYYDVINRFGSYLSEDDINNLQLKHTSKDMLPTKRIEPFHHSQYPDIDTQFFGVLNDFVYADPFMGSYGSGNSVLRFYHNFVQVTHLEQKAFRKVGFLTYKNEYNEKITELQDESFIIPDTSRKEKLRNKYGEDNEIYFWFDEETQTEFEFEQLQIPRVYEATRLGRDIYIMCREKPYQTTSIDDPFTTCKLGYHGRCYSSNNARPISVLERMKPYNFLYMITMNMLTKHIARYKGILTDIDTSQTDLNLAEDGDPAKALEARLKYIDLGYNIYNSLKDAESGENIYTGRKQAGTENASNAQDLLNLINILQQLNTEIGMIVGVSPQRLAQMTSQNVADNQQALLQSSYITEPYFNAHNETQKEIMLSYLQIFIIQAKEKLENDDQLFLNYILDDSSSELLKILPDTLEETDYGLFVQLSGNMKEYFDTMKNLTHALIQNDQANIKAISSLLLSIANTASPYEVHKQFEKFYEEDQQRKQSIEQQKLQAQQDVVDKQIQAQKELEQMRIENREDEQKHEQDMQERKYEFEKELKAIDVYKLQQDLDVDKDGTPDPLEAAELQHKINIEQRKLANDERSQAFEEVKFAQEIKEREKDREVEKKKITKSKSKND